MPTISPAIVDSDAGGGNLGETRDVQITSDGAYAIMAVRGARCTVMNCADPANLTLAGFVQNTTVMNVPEGSATQGDNTLLACITGPTGGTGGIAVVNHATKSAPTVAASLANPTSGDYVDSLKGAIEVAWPGRYAYVAAKDGNAIGVIDMQTPASPVIVGKITHANLLGPHGIACRTVAGQDRLYVGDSNQLLAWNVTNPLAPAFLGETANQSGEISQLDAYADNYVAAITNGAANKIYVFDVSNAAAPTVAGSLVNSNLDRPLGVTVTHDLIAIVPCQTDIGRVAFVDVATPTAPAWLANIDQPTPGSGADPGSGELYHSFTAAIDPTDTDIVLVAVAGSGRLTSLDLNRSNSAAVVKVARTVAS